MIIIEKVSSRAKKSIEITDMKDHGREGVRITMYNIYERSAIPDDMTSITLTGIEVVKLINELNKYIS